MSDQTRCRLDKVTARHILEGLLKLAEARALHDSEITALAFHECASARGLRQFIVPATESVLQRLGGRPRYAGIIHLFLQRVEVVFPTRYFKRWARRLQEYSFAPEDAGVLAVATFGTDRDARILGMHAMVTFDQPLITQWTLQHTAIQMHLTAMRHDLRLPYNQASLPLVLRPEEVKRQSSFPRPS